MSNTVVSWVEKLWTREQGARFVRLFLSAIVGTVVTLATAGKLQLNNLDFGVLGSAVVGALEVAYRAWRPAVTVTPEQAKIAAAIEPVVAPVVKEVVNVVNQVTEPVAPEAVAPAATPPPVVPPGAGV